MFNKNTQVSSSPFEIGETFYVTGADMLPDGIHRLVHFYSGDQRYFFKRLVVKELDKHGVLVKSGGQRRVDVLGSLSS